MKRLAPESLPYWPRLLSRELAAAYLGQSVTTFEAGVSCGDWPAPLKAWKRGHPRWDKHALDRALDIRSGLSSESVSHPRLGDLPWGKSA